SPTISVRDERGRLVWDSGDDLEQLTAKAFGKNFTGTRGAGHAFPAAAGAARPRQPRSPAAVRSASLTSVRTDEPVPPLGV
ncbi:hypothetical protein AB0R12_39210, partial [Streptomyces niveus]|uniref:hypothetical protein n=1 Tax=Streptomyces niveus TaxID=193462 RepID=UPI00342C8ABC